MYTTEIAVRRLLPALLIDEDFVGSVDSGTLITLNAPAYDVPTIDVDGTTLTKGAAADFTFTRPRTITLAVAASGSNYTPLCYYGLADAQLAEIISQADNIIDGFFLYLDKPSASYLADISSWLSVSIYLKSYATATEENMVKADRFNDMAMDTLNRLKENLYNRTSGSLVRKVNA